MYDHTFSKLANHQIIHQATHKVGCQPGGLRVVTSVFLRVLCGYVWVTDGLVVRADVSVT